MEGKENVAASVIIEIEDQAMDETRGKLTRRSLRTSHTQVEGSCR